jgi:hypothetical protein
MNEWIQWSQERWTYTHRKLIIRKQHRHEVEEVLVVFVELDGLDRNLCEDGFERGGEFAFGFPGFCRVGVRLGTMKEGVRDRHGTTRTDR